jgi:hypothetical protein
MTRYTLSLLSHAAARRRAITSAPMMLHRTIYATLVTAAIAAMASGCAAPADSPTSPTPTVVTPAPAPAPTPTGAPFSIQLLATTDAQFYTDTPWSTILAVLSDSNQVNPVRPVKSTVNCGNGTAIQQLPGFIGLLPISCVYPVAGIYRVTTDASAANGFTAGTAANVAVIVRPNTTPTPTPAPSPAPATPRLVINAAAQRCTPTRASWAFQGQANVPVTSYTFDFGDGATTTTSSPEAGHDYTSDGYRTISVTAARDGADSLTASVLFLIKLAAAGTTTCP